MKSGVINRNTGLIAFVLITIITFLYLFEAIRFKGIFMSGDGNMHYLFSRYSWQHPNNLFDLWAKPVYTLLSSPFAKFGIIGIKVFSIICVALSLGVSYRISEKLKLNNSFIPIIFIAFAPVYFLYANGAYTEHLFGLFLIASIYLFLQNKFHSGSILISWLPFIRAEGYFILIHFLIFLIAHKKWKSIPLIFTGTIIYSIAGYFYFGDILWLLHNNTYNDQMAEVYGKGSFWHFFIQQNDIWGTPFTFFLVIGVLTVIIKILRSKKGLTDSLLWLILLPTILYFFLHVILWWQGFNSLGLIRVLSAIIPLCAIIGLYGFNTIQDLLRSITFRYILIFVTIIFVVYTNYAQYYYPFRLDTEDEVVLKTKNWFQENRLIGKSECVFFLHPFLPIVNDFDPFDLKKNIMIWDLYEIIEKYGYDSLPEKTIVIWDAHYGTNEGKVPLEKITRDKNFRLIKSFYPDKPFDVLGNVPFTIRVFQKSDSTIPLKKIIEFTFESEGKLNGAARSDSISSEGKFSALVESSEEYGLTSEISGDDLDKIKIGTTIIELKTFSENKEDALLVISFHDKNDKQLSWYSEELKMNGMADWQSFRFLDDFSGPENANAVKAKLYVWNKNKARFYVDDIKISY